MRKDLLIKRENVLVGKKTWDAEAREYLNWSRQDFRGKEREIVQRFRYMVSRTRCFCVPEREKERNCKASREQ